MSLDHPPKRSSLTRQSPVSGTRPIVQRTPPGTQRLQHRQTRRAPDHKPPLPPSNGGTCEDDTVEYYEPWSSNYSLIHRAHAPAPIKQEAVEYSKTPISNDPVFLPSSPREPPVSSPHQKLFDEPVVPTKRPFRSRIESVYDTIPDTPTKLPSLTPFVFKENLPARFEGFLPMIAPRQRGPESEHEHMRDTPTFKGPPSPPHQPPPVMPNISRADKRPASLPMIGYANINKTDSREPPVPQTPQFAHSINIYAKRGPEDRNVGPSVVGLTDGTFRKFIEDVDAAFVLFYDPHDKEGGWAKSAVKTAASNTKRRNHVFASVDCRRELQLCEKENVSIFPTMKLYTKGALVNVFTSSVFLDADQMRTMVERVSSAQFRSGRSAGKDSCSVQ